MYPRSSTVRPMSLCRPARFQICSNITLKKLTNKSAPFSINSDDKNGAVALRKMIQNIVGINHSSILYLVYVLLSATAPLFFFFLSKCLPFSHLKLFSIFSKLLCLQHCSVIFNNIMIPEGRIFHNPLLRLIIHIYQPKTFRIASCPLKIIQQRP